MQLGLRNLHIRDRAFSCGIVVTVTLVFFCARACYGAPYAIATAFDVAVIMVVVGKGAGRRLGLRSSFWRSQLALEELLVLALVLICVNLVAFTPATVGH